MAEMAEILERYREFPGAELVSAGIADLREARETPEACLVSLASTRLKDVGISVPGGTVRDPERRLYALLGETDGDSAHGRYNALRRRLVSFIHAAENAR